jgi:hypothetical protein
MKMYLQQIFVLYTAAPISPHQRAHQCLALNINAFWAKNIVRQLTSACPLLYNPITPETTTLGVPFPHRVATTYIIRSVTSAYFEKSSELEKNLPI